MDILMPFLSAAMTLEEFYNGEGAEYSIKYIINPDGTIIKRVESTHGKAFQYKVSKVPYPKGSDKEKKQEKLVPLKEEISWLPAGKVPMKMYKQIENFFKQVMTDLGGSAFKHGDLEAMAHIVWNPSHPDIYQIRIPTQKVSGASVSFTFDHLEEGDEIIVDIHSHNSMGAFFSGTDNNDDKTSTCYSGVIGKLNTASPECKFRFNDMDKKKIDVTLDDIFEEEAVKCDPEWLKKVTRNTYSYGGYRGGRGGYNNPFGTPGKNGAGSGRNTVGGESAKKGTQLSLVDADIDLDGSELSEGFLSMFYSADEMAALYAEMEQEGILEGQEITYVEGIDISNLEEFSSVEAQDFEELIRSFIGVDPLLIALSEDRIAMDELFEVKKRFEPNPSSLPNASNAWIDVLLTEEDESDVYVNSEEMQETVESDGEFYLYCEMEDVTIKSVDVSEDITDTYALYLYLTTYNDGIPAEEILARRKDQVIDFLKNGTSTMDRLLILAFLARQNSNKQTTKGSKDDVPVH